METKNERISARPWFTDTALLIALATFAAYLFALFFEIGYCEYFNIKYYFIPIVNTNVLFWSLITIYVFTGVISVILFLYPIAYIKNNIARFFTIYAIFIFSSSILLLLPLSFEQRIFVWLLIAGFLTGMIIILVRPVFSKTCKKEQQGIGTIIILVRPIFSKACKKGGYWKRLNSSLNPSETNPQLSPLNKSIIVIAIIGSILSLGGIYTNKFGGYVARVQEEFYLHKLQIDRVESEFVIIRAYGENLFAVPLNRAEKTFAKKFFTLKMSEVSNKPLTLEKVGPLKVKQ